MKLKKDDTNCVAIGLCLGLPFGIIFKNLPLGMLLGVGFGGVLSFKNKKK